MEKDLTFKFKNVYDVCEQKEIDCIYEYAEGYGDFLNSLNDGIVYDNGTLASGYKSNAKFANYMAKKLRKTVDTNE